MTNWSVEIRDMDPSLILLHGWDPTGASSDLEVVPYPTLWLESCNAYCTSYVLVSYTMLKELYLKSPYNYEQYFYIRMIAINADNITQPIKPSIFQVSRDQLMR